MDQILSYINDQWYLQMRFLLFLVYRALLFPFPFLSESTQISDGGYNLINFPDF